MIEDMTKYPFENSHRIVTCSAAFISRTPSGPVQFTFLFVKTFKNSESCSRLSSAVMAFFDVNRTVPSLPAYAALPETCRACTMLLRYSITLRFLRLLSQRKQVKFCVVPAWRERLSRDDWTALSAICLRGLSGHSSMLCSRLCSEANHAVLNSRIRGVTIVHLESQNPNTRRISTIGR